MNIIAKHLLNSWRLLVTIVIIVIADLYTKNLIESLFKTYETKNIIGSFVQLILIYNRGGVFGIGQGKTILFLIVSIFVLLFIFYLYFTSKNKTGLFQISIGLVLGGAFGNMYERIFHDKGVVDFIYIGWDKYATIFGYKILLRWPAFNIADSTILVGAFFLAIIMWKEDKKNQQEGANRL